MEINLGEIMARMREQSGAGEAPVFPLKEAQRDELAVIRRQIDGEDARTLKCWDEVTLVHRTGSFTGSLVSDAVLVFWQRLDPMDAYKRLAATSSGPSLMFWPNPDCLIAWLSDQGLRFEVADSAFLIRASSGPIFAEVTPKE